MRQRSTCGSRLRGSMRRLMRSLDLLKVKHSGKHVGEKTIAGVAGHLWGMNPDRVA